MIAARITALGCLLACAACASTPPPTPGPRDGRYVAEVPAQGGCAAATVDVQVVGGNVRGRVSGKDGGGLSGSVDAADGTGFVRFAGRWSTLTLRTDGFEAKLIARCGRREVEGRRL